MSETPPGNMDSLDEAAILVRFVGEDADTAGLVAYALHRRALLAFRAEFARRTGAVPSMEAEQAFLISEITEERLDAYRAEAGRRLGPKPIPKDAPPAPPRRARWMAVFGGPPMLMPDQPDKVNWRGLLYRLGMLLLAVIATSLLLRVLFVRPL